MIGEAPAMHRLFALIKRIASTDSTVLIRGESGTGKELIARAIHGLSPRAKHPLIPVNCGAIPEELLESELFGHVKGAFTGAIHSRSGRFELANQGTLFLDEIGDMSPKLQVKLLRVLQEKVFEPVGAIKSVKADVRVIAATHKDLERGVKEERFREDLYYRLNVVPLTAPPLRERREDILRLVDHFLKRFARERDLPKLTLSPDVRTILEQYPWPGNVRELENLMERLTILVDDTILKSDLPEKMVPDGVLPPPFTKPEKAAIPADLFATPLPLGEQINFGEEVASFENKLILAALDQTGWNKNKAASMLQLKRTTLVEKIRKKGLEKFSS